MKGYEPIQPDGNETKEIPEVGIQGDNLILSGYDAMDDSVTYGIISLEEARKIANDVKDGKIKPGLPIQCASHWLEDDMTDSCWSATYIAGLLEKFDK